MTKQAPPTLLHGFFLEGARRYPQRIALEVAGVKLTYRELAQCAHHAAALLHDCGGPPRRVGLLASRSPAAYVGYLATLLAGATVVPLSPAHPLSRNLALAEIAGVDAVIADDSDPAAAAAIAGKAGVRLLGLAGDAWRAGADAPTPQPAAYSPDRLAYIMFTSGSTGSPKGVPIAHRNICPFIAHHIERYEVEPGSRWTQNGDLNFDASVTAMFVAWGAGGTLVVPRHRELMAPVAYLNAHAITHCVLVPSIVSFARRLRTLTAGSLPGVRCTVFGAEQLTLSQVRDWRAAAANSRIENAYGPTELTVCCAAYWLPEHESQWPQTSNDCVPIGTVYPYLESVIVNDEGRPGSDGELCVRGVQRLSGYLDPAGNAGRFLLLEGGRASVYDGSVPLTPQHWYRTGDRVRLEGGQLVCLGRIDHQVKVRGHRVEPGEVEAVLRGHRAIADVAVVAVTTVDGEVDLMAAYTGTDVGAGELAALVRASLPDYQLPRRFLWLPKFPLTDNGKVDRRALADLLGEQA